MFIEMEEEIIKPEKTESPKSTDRVSQTETINSLEQNKDHTQALESNPDQFPSIANLRIPNADQIEPFQIVDGDKQIAASRKIEQAGSNTFHDGLKALGADATEEVKARYQIDYINKKATGTDQPSELKLYGGISNVPEVTQGIQTIEDAQRFLGALQEAIAHGVLDAIIHLKEPNAVNNDILASIAFLSLDNSQFHKQLIASGEAVLDRLDKPMKPEDRAHDIVLMSPWFIVGMKRSVSEAKAVEKAGISAQELKAMQASERWAKYGVDYVPAQYREAFFKAHPHLEVIRKELIVHHEIPQQVLNGKFGKLFSPTEVHDINFHKGLRKPIHDRITADWRSYLEQNRTPTRDDILRQIQVIRQNYGEHFYP